MDNGAAEQTLLQARTLWQTRRLDQAESLIRSVLASHPFHAEALVALAELLGASGRADETVELLNRLVSAHPDVAAYWRRLGVALLAQGAGSVSARALERAVELDPGNARGHNNLGEAYLAQDDPKRAIECYRRAIGCEPGYALAHSNLGRALLRDQQAGQAIEVLERAVALAPKLVSAHVNLGSALCSSGDFSAALACYERATALDARLASAWSGKADAEFASGSFAAALASAEQAIVLEPNYGPPLLTRSRALRALGRPHEARRCLESVVAVKPDDVNALSELGFLLGSESEHAAASAIFERLAALSPNRPYIQGYRLYLNLLCANWSGYELQVAGVRAAVDRGLRACSPFQSLLFFDSATAQQRCAEALVNDRYPPLPSRGQPPLGESAASAAAPRHNRIRVAYLSGDFGEHAVSRLLAGVLERHDAAQFQTFAFGWGRPSEAAMRARIENAVSQYVDISALGDADVVAYLRSLEIDIAVDLMGHTRGQRTGIFAARPAPVQVNYLGFPGTMGAPYMDYLIADSVVIPDAAEGAYVESIVRLPNCYLPADQRREAAGGRRSRAEVGLPETGFVFCAFNNTFKIVPLFFDIWMRLLSAAPGSVLWLRTDDPTVAANLRQAATTRGIPAERLIFAAREESMTAHLARYRLADLFLDTLPYNAHATACDALSAGLPVLTCPGSTFCGRVASSLLNTLGMHELIAAGIADYERRALTLAEDRASLARIRAKLELQSTRSPLFDPDLYCRNLEAAYRIMWRRQRDGLKAEPITEHALRLARGCL